MSHLAQIAAAKLPILLGAGILGVSLVGSVAAFAGFSLSVGSEVISALAGMAAAGFATRQQ